MSKYHREIGGRTKILVDIYDVLTAYKVACPARAHAVKKLLCSGQRGHKSELQDLVEASLCITRAIELTKEYQEKVINEPVPPARNNRRPTPRVRANKRHNRSGKRPRPRPGFITGA